MNPLDNIGDLRPRDVIVTRRATIAAAIEYLRTTDPAEM